MRVVGSPTFLASRAQSRLQRAVALVICGLGALAAGFVAGRQSESDLAAILGSVGVFVGLGALLLGVPQFAAAGRDREAGAGEDLVVTQLQARLGDEFTYLRRVSIPQHGVEADGILAGPVGAIVLGIRAMDGRFIVRGNDWLTVQPDGSERPLGRSPTWEVARPLRALQRAVQEQGLPRIPVQGAVVLVKGQLQEASLPGVAVVPVDRVAGFVDYLRRGGPADGAGPGPGEGSGAQEEPGAVPPVAVQGLVEFLGPYAGGAPRPARAGGRPLASPGG